MATASATAATVTAASGSRAAHAGAVQKASPNIMSGFCTSTRKTWVHVTMSTGTTCYSGNGQVIFTSFNQTTEICTGNNIGVIEYTNGSTLVFWDFLPGQTRIFSPSVDLNSLTITGSSGSRTC